MRKTLTYKLYRSKRNKRLHHQINIGGVIHNHCIALHKRYYRRYGQYLKPNQLKRHLAKLKKLSKFAFWAELGSQAIQDIVERIDRGYQKFFRGENKRPPGFRKIIRAKSFTLKQTGWKLLGGNRLKIGGTIYKFSHSREIDGEVKTVTIKRNTLGELFVYFSVIQSDMCPDRVMTGQSVGFDFGLSTFLTGSDGREIQAPQPLKATMTDLKRASRALSTKPNGSGHRRRAQRHLARVHRHISHQRRAWHWELARNLCLQYDVIYLEDLNLTGMVKLWGRKMADLGHGTFLRILEYVASQLGTVIHHVERWFPSTKQCHICGALNHDLGLRDRRWTCTCGAVHNRDFNAAINIHREGASSRGVETVRLASASGSC